MPNILYLTYDGLTDPLGQSQVLPYIEGLAKRGYSFTIISFEKPGHNDEIIEIRNRLQEQSIEWKPLSYTKNPPILSTLYDIYRMNREARNLHQMKTFGLIHCRSYVPALVGLSLKRKQNIPFLFDMRGFWADERVEGGLWNMKKIIFKKIYQYFKKKEKAFLNESGGVISLTHAALEEMTTWDLEINIRSKTSVIPCCVDMKLFDPATISTKRIENLKNELGIGSEHILVYLGSLGTWYDIEGMIQYFERLAENKAAKFLIITQSNPDIVRKELSDKKDSLKKNIIITSASRRDVPIYLSLAHEGLFLYRQGFSRKACSPTKLGEMMAMGIPALGNDIGDSKMLMSKYQSGELISNERILDHFAYDVKSIREGAIEYFSLERGVEKYGKMYEKIVNFSN